MNQSIDSYYYEDAAQIETVGDLVMLIYNEM